LLIEAKQQCQHGEWSDWIKSNCECSQRTAQLYMRLFKRWPEVEGKAQRVAFLSFRDAAKLLATPRQTAPEALEGTGRLPGGFLPTSDRMLFGSHVRLPVTVFVAESIEHPGFWNLMVFDERPRNELDHATMTGASRPIIQDRLAPFLEGLLRQEHMDYSSCEWTVSAADRTIREWLDQEAHSLWREANYWWRHREDRNYLRRRTRRDMGDRKGHP
jgi:hypothetical protein